MKLSGGFGFNRRGVVFALIASAALSACGGSPEGTSGGENVVAASLDG